MRTKKLTAVQIWLVIGLFMILMQVFIGGITRLTGSGLSITKWEIVTGIIPPLNEKDWVKEFELYKVTPQYHKINKGMSLEDFKFIFFWEYLHRLWARLMGFVFLLPLIYFVKKGLISNVVKKRLTIVFLLAAVVASFGWIMVASGLIERPWVNAYKLSFHLCLALILFLYLLWVLILEIGFDNKNTILPKYVKFYRTIFVLSFIQIFLGGMMSGMKAALVYPTWPKIGTGYIPDVLLKGVNWTVYNLTHYEKSYFLAGLIHFLHRNLAYFIFLFTLVVFLKSVSNTNWSVLRTSLFINFILLLVQLFLGVFILISSFGSIPLWYGVFHQLIGFVFIGSCLLIITLERNIR